MVNVHLLPVRMKTKTCFVLLVFLHFLMKACIANTCRKCKSWYVKERKNLSWLRELNRKFKCPCKVTLGWTTVTPIDNPSGKQWTRDWACLALGIPLCYKYHPGAYGCLRSSKKTSTGARQQCCYSRSGNIIRPGDRGAGTPDKASTYFKHQKEDVEPYNWCCRSCSLHTYCMYYIADVRSGDASHCP